MTEVENKEGQKTVVAFVSGLLIGGLLVWVFSSAPESAKAPEVTKETKTEESTTTETKTDTQPTEPKGENNEVVKVGEGVVMVDDQPAGNVVNIKSLTLPTEKGWVVVREFDNDTPGNILGAARFDSKDGLVPKTVELIRATKSGARYQVVFFTNGGDVTFGLADDVMIEGVATTFMAH